MQDEGFHEIQLNGKQLVFLFMACTVVAVVVFLSGVMVGRGVSARQLVAETTDHKVVDPTASVPTPSSSASAIDSSGTQPLTAGETLTYPALLEDPNPPAETLAPPVAEPAVARAPVAKPAEPRRVPPAASPKPSPKPASPAPPAAPRVPVPVAALAPSAAAARPAAAPLAVPAGTGFVVQVAAVRQRAEAEQIAKRLNGKGYPAFVTESGTNFRVRVGKFDDRRQAETIAGRLEREERFKPWITR